MKSWIGSLFIGAFLFLNPIEASVSKKRHRGFHTADRSQCHTQFQGPSYPLKPLIMLDAGHGGSDEGAKVGAVLEKKIALKASQVLKEALEVRGYEVRMTRARDEFLSLYKRVELANVVGARLFISLHCNSSPNSEAHGIEVFYYDSKDPHRLKSSKKAASYTLHGLLQQTEAHSRGIKKGNFHVIRETSMPAILIEMGFLTNPDERGHLKDALYIEKIAQGIASGVDRFFNY